MSIQYAKKRKNKKALIIGAIISLLLIAAIIGTVIFKNNEARHLAGNDQNDLQSQNEEDNEKPQKTETSNNEQQPNPSKSNEQAKDDKKTPAVQPDSNGYIPGQKLPVDPTYIKGVLIANKKYPLPSTFAPGENSDAKAAFGTMAEAAKRSGFVLMPFSGYRSFERQIELYDKYVTRDGVEAADRYSARPGYSEHQTGLTYDIGEKGKEDVWLTEAFGETPAGKWVAEHAHEYGFIMRYPKGKEEITGYMYESWHFRYVGVDIATEIYKRQGTLEEYLGISK
ncbi:MAG: M15 family metallopeptidase [Lysinibacillus sp.]